MKRSISLRFFLPKASLVALGLGFLCTEVVGQEPSDSSEASPSESLNAFEESERRIRANAHFAAGIGFHSKGEVENAAKELLSAAETDPNNAPLISRVAEKLLAWRLPTLALQVLENATQEDDAPVSVFIQKGLTLKALGKEAESLDVFKQALAISPGNAEARQAIVAARLKEKDFPGAVTLIREGVALPSLSGEQLIGLVGLYLQTITSSPNLLTELKDEFQSLLDRTEKFDIDVPGQQVILADGFIFVGETDRAQTLLQSVVKKAPDTALAREKLVDLYLRQGMTADAVAELNTLLDINPNNPSAHYLLGSIAADGEEYTDAIFHYEKAIEIRPEFEPPYYEMVGIHLNTRQPRKALRVLQKARSRFPKRFLSEFYSGIAMASLRRTSEALTFLTEAETIASSQAPQRLTPFFYFQLGSMLERNGFYERAEEKFLKSLEANPDDPETLNYLGYMWAEQGKKLRQASAWIEKAIELDPDSAAIQDSMGWVLFQKGEYKKALPYLLNAEAGLDQPDPVILDHLGDTYEALEQFDKAIKVWEASLELEFNERIFEKLQTAKQSINESK